MRSSDSTPLSALSCTCPLAPWKAIWRVGRAGDAWQVTRAFQLGGDVLHGEIGAGAARLAALHQVVGEEAQRSRERGGRDAGHVGALGGAEAPVGAGRLRRGGRWLRRGGGLGGYGEEDCDEGGQGGKWHGGAS